MKVFDARAQIALFPSQDVAGSPGGTHEHWGSLKRRLLAHKAISCKAQIPLLPSHDVAGSPGGTREH